MARYFFPFKMKICTDNTGATEIAEIGNAIGWACTGSLTQQYSFVNCDAATQKSVISQFDDVSNIAGCISNNTAFWTNIGDTYDQLIVDIPLLLGYNLLDYGGQYVKMVSTVDPSFYAVTNTRIDSSRGGFQGTFRLYANNVFTGSIVSNGFTGSSQAFPIPYVWEHLMLCAISVDTDENITAITGAVCFQRGLNIPVQYATRPLNITDANAIAWLNATKVKALESDPYAPGGNSDTGGGTGNFDLTSDQIDVPNVPTLSAVDTGLVTLYTPTLAQLQSLARYLWNADATTIDWWKKLIANPLDLVLGLSIVPVAVPQGATENVYVGLIDTGIAMTKAASQYVQVDCGSLNVTEFYGAALDYLPFRKTSIYLPFIGTRTISTDDIMGKTVQVVYNIDLLSGALTAMVKCGDAVLYQYSGACNIAIPLSGQSFTDLALSTLQLAAGIGATVATGGAVAGVVAANAANSVMSMKPTIERAGGVSGAAGQLAIMRPYLIGEIPRQSVPKNYNQFAGYPSNISAVLGDLSGYTEVETIYLAGITATSDELNEIENLLKSGVYI